MNKSVEPVTERNEMVKELAGGVCRCGAKKVKGQSFCGRCFYRLPRVNRQRMYQAFGQGYEDAYRDAVALLGAVKGGRRS